MGKLTKEKIKVLVVDDSFFIRQAITKMLESEGFEVIDTARNGKEAVEKALTLKPDVITMDIEMPVMTGLEAVKEIMNTFPIPIIMVSTLTTDGAEATIEALSLGAIDFIAKKPAFKEAESIKDELIQKVRTIGSSSELKNQFIRKRLLRRMQGKQQVEVSPQIDVQEKIEKPHIPEIKQRPSQDDIKVIGIGISTGGPNALQEFIPKISASIPVPILIVQHMPPYFTNSLAKRLDSMSNITVKEAEDNETLRAGTAYIAQGGKHLIVNKFGKTIISDEPRHYLFKPSVDVLFYSLAENYGKKTLGIIMTGMGNDGQKGLAVVKNKGGYVIAQSPESCVIDGMPQSVIKANLADEILPLNALGETINSLFNLQ